MKYGVSCNRNRSHVDHMIMKMRATWSKLKKEDSRVLVTTWPQEALRLVPL